MALSLFQRLFGKKERNSDAQSPSLSEGATSLVQPGTSSSDVTKQQNRKPLESRDVDQNAEAKKKVNALFAFVDLKDPFTPSEIAGEELPGPILSTLSAKQFDSVFLLYTPQTRENAVATKDEIERRHKGCRVNWQPLPVSDPKDYSSLMGSLWRYGGDLLRRSDADENYVCVSSGTAEMRAAWFLLTTLGIVKAKLLQVGTPAQPLFGKVYVKELQLDTVDWQTIWQGEAPTAGEEPETAPEEPETAGGGAEERVSSDKKRLETRGSENEALREPPSEEVPEEAEILDDIEPESRKAQDVATEVASARTEEDLLGIVVAEGGLVPGLDDALQELGIHVGSAILRNAAEGAGIAADSHLPVLLLGETGTGKERFAHLIHRLSPRFGKDMVIVNCAAIPAPLAESHLFGHVKGAFSDATSNKEGIFETADQTTLFLDEIAELTLEVQAKLLRVVDDRMVQRLGSHKPRKVDVRLIAATNRDLTKEVSAGRFRQDLYYRIKGIQIKLPPLRERRSEIPELALSLLRQINLRRRKPRQLSSGALMRLERYDWPGNVRQLSNVLERSVLYARGDGIQPDDLLIDEDAPAKDPFGTLPEPFPGFNVEEFLTLARKQLFLKALAVCKGNQTEAAALLGVSKQAVSKFVAGQNDNEN